MKYRTIVADPPWEYPEGFGLGPGHGYGGLKQQPLPYRTMSLTEIADVPVGHVAETDARLFLWTTNRHLPMAFAVVEAWGFVYRQTLVWHKPDVNLPAHVAPSSAEFVLVGVCGKPERVGTLRSSVFSIPRKGGPGHKTHSQKPEAFLDMVESISPGPYLELFARRNRLGWDTWGNESLKHVALV